MTARTITFDVLGIPKPQGSKRAFVAGGRAIMTEDQRSDHAVWRNQVAETARTIALGTNGTPLDGPLRLAVTFRHPMPKSRPKRLRDAGEAPRTTSPDLDKLVRAICDGLQAGGLIVDDARIHQLVASKVETTGWTGATITIEVEAK